MFKRISAITHSMVKKAERRKKYRRKVLVVGAAGAVFIFNVRSVDTRLIQQKQISFIQQKIPKSIEAKWKMADYVQEEELQGDLEAEFKVQEELIELRKEPLLKEMDQATPEDWYETDRKLTDSEWEAMTQMILSEARGESFEVQYCIACIVLNRVDSEYFPNTVEGVLYQTDPVQFQGAWDLNWYEPSESVLEAIQAALEENRTPCDLYYFTSEGWLSGTKAWKQVGGMWFSCQKSEIE